MIINLTNNDKQNIKNIAIEKNISEQNVEKLYLEMIDKVEKQKKFIEIIERIREKYFKNK